MQIQYIKLRWLLCHATVTSFKSGHFIFLFRAGRARATFHIRRVSDMDSKKGNIHQFLVPTKHNPLEIINDPPHLTVIP